MTSKSTCLAALDDDINGSFSCLVACPLVPQLPRQNASNENKLLYTACGTTCGLRAKLTDWTEAEHLPSKTYRAIAARVAAA